MKPPGSFFRFLYFQTFICIIQTQKSENNVSWCVGFFIHLYLCCLGFSAWCLSLVLENFDHYLFKYFCLIFSFFSSIFCSFSLSFFSSLPSPPPSPPAFRIPIRVFDIVSRLLDSLGFFFFFLFVFQFGYFCWPSFKFTVSILSCV